MCEHADEVSSCKCALTKMHIHRVREMIFKEYINRFSQ